VLQDNCLPGITGIETTIDIRDNGYSGHIVGLTGDSNIEVHIELVNAGCTMVVLKPIKAKALSTLCLMFGMPPRSSEGTGSPSSVGVASAVMSDSDVADRAVSFEESVSRDPVSVHVKPRYVSDTVKPSTPEDVSAKSMMGCDTIP
jgi:CheY-like chemotaxis protein